MRENKVPCVLWLNSDFSQSWLVRVLKKEIFDAIVCFPPLCDATALQPQPQFPRSATTAMAAMAATAATAAANECFRRQRELVSLVGALVSLAVSHSVHARFSLSIVGVTCRVSKTMFSIFIPTTVLSSPGVSSAVFVPSR